MAKSIMFQGTMSNVGKSFIVTGMCRYFKNKGYKVAPFKSQNMALNSFITKDGAEIGRAQAAQAFASGIDPDYRMNPILLKPSSDKGSQIILNGHAIGEKSAKEYFLNKKAYIPYIMEDYDSLAKDFDIIVIEGAGSPAEMNLKKDDIVNMGLAKMVNAPVMLAGDINPGGVFAQLYGTLALLDKDERDIVKGLIINKFRGDKTLFKSGIDFLEEKTKKKVFGVIPFSDVRLEAEDSLVIDKFNEKDLKKSLSSEISSYGRRADSNIEKINISIINFPWASNLTDFDPLWLIPEISIHLVDEKEKLGKPDLIILPGTKNTMHDTRWLFESGLNEKIISLNKEGVPVVGICGGYQILGERLFDKNHIDGDTDEINGLGLLPIETFFNTEKITRNKLYNVNDLPGIFNSISGLNVNGYEIHMGISHVVYEGEGVSFVRSSKDADLGFVKGNVLGTYIHGIFENDIFREKFIQIFSHHKSMMENKLFYHDFREKQFDDIANLLEENLDMNEICNIMNI